jgi:hypothetical protein
MLDEILIAKSVSILDMLHVYPLTDLAQFHGTLFGFHMTAILVFTFFLRISNFFDLSIAEET